ncbi:MAG: Na+/H+ antiporter subunit E [Pseudomonadota bacterium]
MYLGLLTLSLTVFWLVLSGYWDNPLILGLGVVSIGLCVWIAVRIRRHYRLYSALPILTQMPAYTAWLAMEIVKSNLMVIKHIWFSDSHPITPTVRRIRMLQKTPLGQTIFANSITLTPGTVSFRIDGDHVVVHGVMQDAVDDLQDGDMNQRVARLEGKALERLEAR